MGTYASSLANALAHLERLAGQSAASAGLKAGRLQRPGTRRRGSEDARGDGEEHGGDGEELHFSGLKVVW